MSEAKQEKYQRIYEQLVPLMEKTRDLNARMATIVALLHNKFNNYFWTGFYFVHPENMTVGVYQGSVACLTLPKPKGICWDSVLTEKPIIVPDVNEYSNHIACDARSKSEIVIPVQNNEGNVFAVLDVDSDKINAFDEIDREFLTKIITDFISNV